MSAVYFMPQRSKILQDTNIGAHLLKAATNIDRISILVNNTHVQGNFGFFQQFRKVIPVLNIRPTLKPALQSEVQVQYHGMGCCWSFTTKIVGFSLEGHWLLAAPSEIHQNEARRAPRFLLSSHLSWVFTSAQGLGDFNLHDLSTLGCSFLFPISSFGLRKNEQLRGTLKLNSLSVPVILQIRHIDRHPSFHMQKISGCSFEEIATWGQLQIHEQLQKLPNSFLRRIQ